jgi:predicted ATP-dependent serine protease
MFKFRFVCQKCGKKVYRVRGDGFCPECHERETVRNRLSEAGFLVTDILTDDDEQIIPIEETMDVLKLPPDAPTIQQILDEDRGD